MHYSVHEAKTHLSKLLAEVAQGKEVIITSGRSRKHVAKISRIEEQELPAVGFAKHWPKLGPEFFKALSEEELRLANGEGD